MREVVKIVTSNHLLVAGAAAVGIVLVAMSAVWACTSGPPPDMTLENADNAAWNDGNEGENFSDCPVDRYLNHNLGLADDCTRDVDVHGENFIHNVHDGDPDTNEAMDSVDLYWLDGATFLGGAGGPGDDGQRVTGQVCRESGVELETGVGVASDGTFSTTVTVPPTDGTRGAQSLPRLVKAHYGPNAVCAVWHHDDPGDPHDGGVGNQYNIFPL